MGDSGSGVSAFTITLGGADSSGAILFTSLDGRMPAPGRYELSDTAATGFRATYVAGSPERPTGLFRAKRGTLEITGASAEHVSGHFSFTGAGFLASDPSDEGSEVKVNGAFLATHTPAAGQPNPERGGTRACAMASGSATAWRPAGSRPAGRSSVGASARSGGLRSG